MSKPKAIDLDQAIDKLAVNPQPRSDNRVLQTIGAPIDKAVLIRELEAAELMIDTHPQDAEKGLCVYRAVGSDIPKTMLEIGRLREETFRTVGEGSGMDRDLDQFDSYYNHFWAWDKIKKEITGAYRIGRLDKILAEKGVDGVYTNTLFNMEKLLHSDFREGTLEAGRSFVRPEYQRGLSLLLIWSGLGRFISKNLHYKFLVGPVSISSEFKENSKHLMVSYLMKNHPHEKSDMVVPKNPPKFESNLSPEELTALVDAALDLSNLQDLVRHAEGNPKAQIPQLIKLYLELGVRFLAFHQDDDFNSVDGLICLDITKIPQNIGVRYLGPEGWDRYKAYHHV